MKDSEFTYDVQDDTWTHDMSGWSIKGVLLYGLYNSTIQYMFKQDTGLDISNDIIDTMRDVSERMQNKTYNDWTVNGQQ